MSTSYATTLTESFTVTHAKKLASKVATDLLRFHRFYNGIPSMAGIDAYERELVELLKYDYLNTVTYGFERNGNWVIAVKYRALSGGVLVADDDPGKIKPGEDVDAASFSSFLEYNSNWGQLPAEEKERFRTTLPFRRTTGTEPGIENGWWVNDLNYSAGGRGISRSTIKKW